MDAKKEVISAGPFNMARNMAVAMCHMILSDLYSPEYADIIIKMVSIIDQDKSGNTPKDFKAIDGISECIFEAMNVLGDLGIHWQQPFPYVKFNDRVFNGMPLCEELNGPVEDRILVHIHALQVQEFRYFVGTILDSVMTKVDTNPEEKLIFKMI